MTGRAPQVFISYQRTDGEFARHVREHLAARGVVTWMDQYDIAVGAYWTDEIDKGLAGSDVVVGVLSPDSVASRNVKTEWDWAIANHKRLALLTIAPSSSNQCGLPRITIASATGVPPSNHRAPL